MIRAILAALLAAFGLAAAAAAQDEAVYYGGVRFAPTADGADRMNEIISTYYAPIEDVLADNVVEFFATDGSSDWAFFGPFETPEAALAAANWQDNAAWRAALVAEVGDADEAAALVDEHLALTNVQERFAAKLTTTSGADMAPDAAVGAYYVARTVDFADDGKARAQELLDTYFAPADQAVGLEVIEFLGVDTDWDNLAFLGPLDTAEAADAVISGANEGAFIGALSDLAGDADHANALLEEFDAFMESNDVVAVTRGQPAM